MTINTCGSLARNCTWFCYWAWQVTEALCDQWHLKLETRLSRFAAVWLLCTLSIYWLKFYIMDCDRVFLCAFKATIQICRWLHDNNTNRPTGALRSMDKILHQYWCRQVEHLCPVRNRNLQTSKAPLESKRRAPACSRTLHKIKGLSRWSNVFKFCWNGTY